MENFSLLVNATNQFVYFPLSWELLNVAPIESSITPNMKKMLLGYWLDSL